MRFIVSFTCTRYVRLLSASHLTFNTGIALQALGLYALISKKMYPGRSWLLVTASFSSAHNGSYTYLLKLWVSYIRKGRNRNIAYAFVRCLCMVNDTCLFILKFLKFLLCSLQCCTSFFE